MRRLLVVAALLAPGFAAAQQACAGVKERAAEVRAELESAIPGAATIAASSGGAAAALLAGDLRLAAWLGLRVAAADWNGKTVADAGIYLQYLDRRQDAVRLLTCAHAMGLRAPHLFEALAVVHKAEGRAAEARAAIAEAQRLAPGDALIELQASLIDTGKPPPAPKPDANDAVGRCIAELERHSQRVLAVRKQNHLRHDRLQNADHRQKAFAGEPQIHQELIKNVRQVAANARRAGDAFQHNTAIAQCAGAYFMLTGFLLDSYYFTESMFELVFWADTLGLDAPVFVRDLPCGSAGNVCDPKASPHNSLLSRAAEDKQHLGMNEASKQYYRDIDACGSGDAGCRLRARGRECKTNKALLEELFAVRGQRVNTAGRNFDNEAHYVVSLAEGEIGAAREFAVGLLPSLRKGGPVDSFGMAVQQIDQAYQMLLLQPHLLAGGKVEQFIQDQARWYAQQKEWVEQSNAQMKQSHDSQCEPVMLELRMEALREQYQAYLEHLRDRLRWGVDSRVDTKFPCDLSFGGLSLDVDLNDLGDSKLGYKVKRGPLGGGVSAGKDGLSFGGGAGGKIRGVGVGAGGDSASAGGRYGPFAGKGDVAFTTARNPWNNREYLGIRLRGSAGFGFSGKKGGGNCYPTSGEVTVYPRAVLEDLGNYLSAKR